jgi:starch synthase (maltosyl-transferring)
MPRSHTKPAAADRSSCRPPPVVEGRRRVVIEGVNPEIDAGRFPIKRVIGDRVAVEADIFADGHDALSAVLKYRAEGDPDWAEAAMEFVDNDRWRGEFVVTEIGRCRYTIEAWIDSFASWRHGFLKKVDAGQEVEPELALAAELVGAAARRASGDDRTQLAAWESALRGQGAERAERVLSSDLAGLMARNPDRRFATTYERELSVTVDRERARFGAWYEMFPRSAAATPGKHGTFEDVEKRLPYVAAMGFDVLYLPPIHPIGTSFRKGKNNAIAAAPGDPGSPWAIGAEEGGHKAIHPELGSLEDFRRLQAAARDHGLEIALDIAFQCTPDHPYVREHPEWFRRRPDGTIQYAENPPKKYQDIYPIDFETQRWRELWQELKSIFVYWAGQGVRIFRVDNPHTKAFAFWEWCIAEVKADYPDAIFLAEAFTKPKVMRRLAKLGFSQSYTYFTWRNAKSELEQYFTELTQTEMKEYFRPNLWPNTPDILNESLQLGGRPAFMTRLVLAATLGASYGIYGPAFELCVNRPREAGSEEYLDSEKYEIKRWEIERVDSLKDYIAVVNRSRRENPALWSDASLRFHPVDNDRLICYSKTTADFSNTILVVVNLDPHYTQSGWVDLTLEALRLDAHAPYEVHDLITDQRYRWQGPRNFVELHPHSSPAHIFRIRRRITGEQEVDNFA